MNKPNHTFTGFCLAIVATLLLATSLLRADITLSDGTILKYGTTSLILSASGDNDSMPSGRSQGVYGTFHFTTDATALISAGGNWGGAGGTAQWAAFRLLMPSDIAANTTIATGYPYGGGFGYLYGYNPPRSSMAMTSYAFGIWKVGVPTADYTTSVAPPPAT